MSWHQAVLLPHDLETTGTDPETAQIVTAFVGQCGSGQPTIARNWLVAVEIDIPEATTRIHGITTEHARQHGQAAGVVIPEIVDALRTGLEAGGVIVGHNVGIYDLTVLDRECRRHLGTDLGSLLERPAGPVVDTRTLDQHVVKKRKNVLDEHGRKLRGSRTLRTTCEAHGLSWDETLAHQADYDAMQAARLAYRLAVRFPQLQMSPERIHQAQVKWAGEQAAELQGYLRLSDPKVVVDGSWPMRPYDGQTAGF